MQKTWYNIHNTDQEYDGTEAPYANPSDFPWTKEFELHAAEIYDELKQYLRNNNLKGYFITSMVSRQNSWRTISLRTWGIEQFRNRKHFPYTYSLIKKYPQIVSSSFNLLEANSKIHLHSGDTNAIYRCHLGLDIPAGLPECGFNVKDETRAWENGKWLIFMDAYPHEAYNNSQNDRFIFVLDVIRNENEKEKVCATVMTSLFLQKRWQKYSFLKKLSPSGIGILAKLLQPFSRGAIQLVNLLKVY